MTAIGKDAAPMTAPTFSICERLVGELPSYTETQAMCRDARETIEALVEALDEARCVIAEERDNMVDCATAPPDHDIATLDPMTKPCVDEYDAALAKIDTALTLAREGATHDQQ